MLRIDSATKNLGWCIDSRATTWDSQPHQILHFVQNDMINYEVSSHD